MELIVLSESLGLLEPVVFIGTSFEVSMEKFEMDRWTFASSIRGHQLNRGRDISSSHMPLEGLYVRRAVP